MASSDYIWCPQKVAESGEVAFIIPARSLADNDGFGAALSDDLLKLGGNRIKGLIPANSLKGSRSMWQDLNLP